LCPDLGAGAGFGFGLGAGLDSGFGASLAAGFRFGLGLGPGLNSQPMRGAESPQVGAWRRIIERCRLTLSTLFFSSSQRPPLPPELETPIGEHYAPATLASCTISAPSCPRIILEGLLGIVKNEG